MSDATRRADDRLTRLRKRLKELPDKPGVYLHKDRRGTVLYVGKARNLRSRVGSYLSGKAGRDVKTVALVSEIDEIDFVTTSNELEAILLENNLIKTHQPKYNVLLRDDKTYPYLKLTMSEDFPRLVFTRKVRSNRRDEYFGPFFAGTARRILKLVQDQFRIRSCDLEIEDGVKALPRPCLYYDMKRCPGPCVPGLTSRPEYLEAVSDVRMFLNGRSRELQEALKQKMYRAAEAEQFEVARHYRDLIRTVETLQSEQKIASAGGDEVDVWGMHEEGGDAAVQVFIFRDGNLVDRRELFWEQVGDLPREEFLGEIVQRYYQSNLFLPREVHLPFAPAETDLIEQWLSSRKEGRVTVRVPKRGKGADRMRLATRNAEMSHQTRFRRSRAGREREAAAGLASAIGFDRTIRRIESFDISNIQGSDSVAAMVVWDEGRFEKKDYRTFNIRSVEGADDFRSIAEAVERRYRRLVEEKRPLPDLILIDGGRGQLNAAMSALDRLEIEGIAVAGLAKREEEIHLPSTDEPLRLSRRDPALQLLQAVRDETHRFAVSSHRKRRSRRTLRSELDELAGIGPKRRRLLLEHFGSLSAVRQASIQDLSNVLGPKVGQTVYEQLHA